MNRILRRVTEHRAFSAVVLAVILVNALILGIETSPEIMRRHASTFHFLNVLVQAIFVAEILLRIAAHLPRPADFFRSGWNLFDTAVVAVSLVPSVGPFATVARLARLLRATRLVSVLPGLRILVATMLRSVGSIGNVALLLGLLLYVYAILGIHFFAGIDPKHWGNLGQALLTLFQVITLEGWIEVHARVAGTYPASWLFFVSYVVIAVFVVINLFIAVIVNNLERAYEEERLAATHHDAHREMILSIRQIRDQLDRIEQLSQVEQSTPSRRL